MPDEQATVPETWEDSQEYELDFWKHDWAYRDLPRSEILEVRRKDASWFLGSFGFLQETETSFETVEGRVLEVGCGPIGFFEGIEDVSVLAIDTLMAKYAEHLGFAQLGHVDNVEYADTSLKDVKGEFDYVVCSNVLDHTSDWRAFLSDLLSRVTCEGSLLLYTHSRSKPSRGHTQTYRPNDLVSQVLSCGVQDVPLMRFEREESGHAEFHNYLRCCVSQADS